MKKVSISDLKVIEISPNVYQIEADKKGVVVKVKSRLDALIIACEYLGIKCDKNALNLNK
jgi:hypothetical protein